MKIPASIRRLYDDQNEVSTQLKARVDSIIRPGLHHRWHYESRIKSIESFTLKIESGRYENPSALEDFFAATIVVRNGSELADAVKLAGELFAFAFRRPENDAETRKAPEAFPFDDLRLYVRWKDAAALPPTGLNGILFEVQIKTFLQHAWSIATHDLIYKSDEASWSKMRIAYQIKAMLEHAELSIQEAVKLSLSDALAKSDARTAALKTFMTVVNDLWEKENLPSDIRRLAENIMTLAKLVDLDAAALRLLLEEEKVGGRGPLIGNLSPYGAVLQTLIDRKHAALNSALTKKQRKSVLIPAEIAMPEGVNTTAWQQSAIFIKAI
jgi:ppGpp synthetase/RelA/SpoT-type nucleotidyltranferase